LRLVLRCAPPLSRDLNAIEMVASFGAPTSADALRPSTFRSRRCRIGRRIAAAVLLAGSAVFEPARLDDPSWAAFAGPFQVPASRRTACPSSVPASVRISVQLARSRRLLGCRAVGGELRAVLQEPGAEEALAAFAKKCPKVVASAEPNFLGNPCTEADLRTRFQLLGSLVGRGEALPLVEEEPLLLAMLAPNLQASWEALLEVAGDDRTEALRVMRHNPACLMGQASELRTKTLRDFELAADGLDMLKPVTNVMKEIGPEGVALGAAALGFAALGALASKVAKDASDQKRVDSEKQAGSFDKGAGRKPSTGRD